MTTKLTPVELDDLATYVTNNLTCASISPASWASGMGWYRKANEFIHGLNKIVDIPYRRLGWALAALSPLNSWQQNKIDLVNLVTTGHCGALGPCRVKALRVLDGERPQDVLGGNKVLAFGSNIVDPWRSRKVTLDSHMSQFFGFPAKLFERVGVYDTVAMAMRQHADNIGVRPHQLQAALWTEQRGNGS